MKQKRVEWIISILFSIIGIVIVGTGIYFQIANANFMKTAIKTDAVIESITSHLDSDNDRVYDVYVSYQIEGEVYGGELNSWNNKMYEGKTVSVYYNPANPADFKDSSANYIGFLVIGLGSLFAIIGIGFFVTLVKKLLKYKKLMQTGERVVATIDNITLNTNYAVNGVNPYVLTCTYVDPTTNKVYTFVSDNIWFNIKSIVEENDLKTVSVYIDSKDPREYVIDIKELQKYIGNQI